MKKTAEMEKLHQMLKSDRFVAGGFLGSDERFFLDIIDDDIAELSRINITAAELAQRMQQITEAAIKGLGTWVKVDEKTEAKVDEAKGGLVCPWPHRAGLFAKRVTTVKRLDTGQTIFYSDLNIHFISEHSFFEGKGSSFRLEPRRLVEMIF
ncbi:MAG: hypothetical protein PHF37_06045 [Phycisphaerae bacterium]|nr:hypothetical protein [Phycisphaerae bacterium]